ncbi:MAG: PQQ-binding-like beta-propeller repeat protein [Planctomycetia bacterium]|nr:PQQ-binding-like beta-propeller repeat protein [Planctomycetia bacterium]
MPSRLHCWLAALCLALVPSAAMAELPAGPGDWPQWRGPNRDGISRETGLLKDWPEGGPKKLWEVDRVGVGYSSLSIKDGRIFTQGDLDGVEHVICLSARDGSVLWQVQPDKVAALLVQRVADEMKRFDRDGSGQLEEVEGLAAYGPRAFSSDAIDPDANAESLAGSRAAAIFEAYDKDDDGKLSFAELPLLRDEFLRVDAQDKDADNAALARQRAEVIMKSADKDGDEKLSRDESRPTIFNFRFGEAESRDPATNRGDNLLTTEEMEQYFVRREPGRDGLVTANELKDFFLRNYPRRDGVLSATELRGIYGGLRDGMGDGPRGTPTIDGDRVYSEGGLGDVSCLDAATGKTLWQKSLATDLGGARPGWGYSESPLIEGDLVIVTPGGNKGTLAALNKYTGEVVWRSNNKEGAQYSSPVVAELAGVRQIVQFARESVFGVTADKGELLWKYSAANNGTANCATPIPHADHVFASSSYGAGGGLVHVSRDGDGQKAEEVYFEKRMANHHGGIVLVEDYMYGYGNGGLICMNYLTGKIAWTGRGGKGSLVVADGMLYCLDEGQKMSLVEASPGQYTVRGEFKIESQGRPSWAHPVVAGGRLYIRNQQKLACYDICAP